MTGTVTQVFRAYFFIADRDGNTYFASMTERAGGIVEAQATVEFDPAPSRNGRGNPIALHVRRIAPEEE